MLIIFRFSVPFLIHFLLLLLLILLLLLHTQIYLYLYIKREIVGDIHKIYFITFMIGFIWFSVFFSSSLFFFCCSHWYYLLNIFACHAPNDHYNAKIKTNIKRKIKRKRKRKNSFLFVFNIQFCAYLPGKKEKKNISFHIVITFVKRLVVLGAFRKQTKNVYIYTYITEYCVVVNRCQHYHITIYL